MRFRILFIGAFSLLLSLAASSQDFNNTISLADKHYSSGQITEALYTYQRAAFFSETGADADLLLKIAGCFENMGDFERSIEYFDHAFYSESSDSLKKEIIFKKANSFIQTRNYNFALIELLGMESEEGSLLDRRKSVYLGSAYYGLEDFEKANSYFLRSISSEDQEARESIRQIFGKRSNFYRPNPKTALWLSVFIPGMGQLYSANWSAGLNSFLLTGSFVGLSLYLSSLYHPIDALLTALPWFQRYYQGGFGQAEEIAGIRREYKRNMAYQNILSIIKTSNMEEL